MLPANAGPTLLLACSESTAIISSCGTYRYRLTRRWDDRPMLGWIMVNPSSADDDADDPTIRRCKGFAAAWGFGGIVVCNLYALRSTDPSALRTHPDPVGPDNDEHLVASTEALTVAAWGVHGAGERSTRVRVLFDQAGRPLYHLGLTRSGQPRHPLYLPRAIAPQIWRAPAINEAT